MVRRGRGLRRCRLRRRLGKGGLAAREKVTTLWGVVVSMTECPLLDTYEYNVPF